MFGWRLSLAKADEPEGYGYCVLGQQLVILSQDLLWWTLPPVRVCGRTSVELPLLLSISARSRIYIS
jgi:hypothetical protein